MCSAAKRVISELVDGRLGVAGAYQLHGGRIVQRHHPYRAPPAATADCHVRTTAAGSTATAPEPPGTAGPVVWVSSWNAFAVRGLVSTGTETAPCTRSLPERAAHTPRRIVCPPLGTCCRT